ncbi:MAG: SpoIIE family protein phosphatase, partial [Leptospira sp.]|nr:SpoIIE family protein phosphatase [Leptospira sp.]
LLWGGQEFTLDLLTNQLSFISERIILMLLFMYGFVGFYHLLLFAKRPKEKYNLYFGLFCLLIAVYNYTRSNTIYEMGVDSYFWIRLEYIVLFYSITFCTLFFDQFFTNKSSKFTRIYFGFVTVLAGSMLFIPGWFRGKILLTWQLSALLILIYLIYSMTRAVMKKNRDAFRLAFGFLVVVVAAVLDLLGAIPVGNMKNLGLTKYGFFAFVIGIAVVLANRFLRVHNQVEELNTHLERKVEERTAELQNTLNEVKTLKVQQDGDYFLTSLLIKPLGVNQSVSSRVTIDFIVQQKKKFEFKNWTTEIGGDLCIAHSIKLKNRDYTVFLNGDAMGKSIQGAGGALVLGVVFKSVIARTQIFSSSQDQYPEQWLKHCFIELQNIFESFDGSMLVSLVMGMVEDTSGLMYYINAEHPWCVLYRDGKASFIDNDLLFHKIGIMGINGTISVRTFQLMQGDAIIVGSDGRDDILIGTEHDGSRIINEDEFEFLHRVEEGEGNLENIAQSIQKIGELTDDFTLMRISFLEQVSETEAAEVSEKFSEHITLGKKLLNDGNPDNALVEFEAAYSINNMDAELIKDMGKSYLKNKNYARAATLLEDCTILRPGENELIYLASFANKMNKDLKKAADLGERYKLREPKNTKNLINLADIYRLLGNFERAKEILGKALAIEPENPNAQKLEQILRNTDEPVPI